MPYIVYVLSDEDNNLYKGCTNNLKRRLKKHLSGGTFTTRKMSNPKVVYTEEYDTFAEARSREVYLKTAAGRRFLKKVLTNRP